MLKRLTTFIAAVFLGAVPSGAQAWDHPGHMAVAAIAFAEIERAQPKLIERIGELMLKHPDPAPFWVAAGEAEGKERARRMFIECARWPDDSKFTGNDRLTWHTARWAIGAKDIPPGAKVAARHGNLAGPMLIPDKEEFHYEALRFSPRWIGRDILRICYRRSH